VCREEKALELVRQHEFLVDELPVFRFIIVKPPAELVSPTKVGLWVVKDPLKSQDHLHHHKKQERENGLDDTEVIVEIEQ